jgi:hypothetical protein
MCEVERKPAKSGGTRKSGRKKLGSFDTSKTVRADSERRGVAA